MSDDVGLELESGGAAPRAHAARRARACGSSRSTRAATRSGSSSPPGEPEIWRVPAVRAVRRRGGAGGAARGTRPRGRIRSSTRSSTCATGAPAAWRATCASTPEHGVHRDRAHLARPRPPAHPRGDRGDLPARPPRVRRPRLPALRVEVQRARTGASRRAAERFGFTFEGIFRRRQDRQGPEPRHGLVRDGSTASGLPIRAAFEALARDEELRRRTAGQRQRRSRSCARSPRAIGRHARLVTASGFWRAPRVPCKR